MQWLVDSWTESYSPHSVSTARSLELIIELQAETSVLQFCGTKLVLLVLLPDLVLLVLLPDLVLLVLLPDLVLLVLLPDLVLLVLLPDLVLYSHSLVTMQSVSECTDSMTTYSHNNGGQ